MKQIVTVLLLIAASFSALPLTSQAQAAADEAAIKACLENYMSGDGHRMEKAFHSTAFMKYVDYQTGEFKDVPIATFIDRMKSNPPKGERKTAILSLNIEGSAAHAKIKTETGKVILYDFMNLLKIDGEWKIVSKIFSRQDK